MEREGENARESARGRRRDRTHVRHACVFTNTRGHVQRVVRRVSVCVRIQREPVDALAGAHVGGEAARKKNEVAARARMHAVQSRVRSPRIF